MAHEHFWFSGMWFFPVFFLLVFLVFAYLAFRVLSSRCAASDQVSSSDSLNSPLEVLKMRYVKGEISRDEFAQIRKDIQGENEGDGRMC
ncbi:SHOCT domain-containing protein [Ferrimonas sediminicola]|uniref:SHOCT domain-containing protein n=1 Tax=Ferrimonas sediminicola TaxID=2569538 RepID=A0A4U1BFS0_9GAMM|nr:SHOCT domain-containing protein [Ferrimonas sediminicola]